ncbi:MAG: hypothetical protein U0807_14885 [Candidatus Binatia bacterium]
MHALRRLAFALAFLTPPVAAIVVWHSILDNYFYADDFLHLYDLATRSLPSLLGQVTTGHPLTVFNLVSLATIRVFGPEPRPFFWLALGNHVLNTTLLFIVIRAFTSDAALACLGAVVWGTSAILEGALGWYSVHGQVLLTTIVLAVIWNVHHWSRTTEHVPQRTALLWLVLLAAGSTAFGMGLGLIAVFPAFAVVLLGREPLRGGTGGLLVLGVIGTLAAYGLWLSCSRDMEEPVRELLRDTTTSHALVAVVVLFAHLFAFGTGALLLGGLGVSPTDMSGRLAGTAILLLIAALAFAGASPRGRRHLLALTLVVAATWGTVAAGRATLLAALGVSAATAAGSTRYHYLPVALLGLTLCTALGNIASRGPRAARVVRVAAVAWTVALLGVRARAPLPIDHWPAQRVQVEAMLRSIREQIARTPPGQVTTIVNQPFDLRVYLPTSLPGWAAMFVVFFPENTVAGRPVRFLVSAADWSSLQARGGRAAELAMRREEKSAIGGRTSPER